MIKGDPTRERFFLLTEPTEDNFSSTHTITTYEMKGRIANILGRSNIQPLLLQLMAYERQIRLT